MILIMKYLLIFSTLLVCALSAPATTLPLVTPQEMEASNSALPPFTSKFAPEKDAPKIQVITPKLAESMTSPTAIELSFAAVSPAAIKPETFKVLYGAFQIDITKRLLASAKVTPQGISVQEATLPSGSHRLHLWVDDSFGRKGYRFIEFQIN